MTFKVPSQSIEDLRLNNFGIHRKFRQNLKRIFYKDLSLNSELT